MCPVIRVFRNIQYSAGPVNSPNKGSISAQGIFQSPSQKVGHHKELDLIPDIFAFNILAFYITGGLLEVQPHSVTVLADTALRGDQLDEAAALAAQHEAEQALEGASEETDIARAQLELAEARARYRAAQKLKGSR